MDLLGFWLTVLVLCSGFLVSEGWHVQYEESLQTTLLDKYTTTVRPSTTVDVYVTQVPLSLNGLDISRQEMSFTAVYVFMWYDVRLMWDPKYYGGITHFAVPKENVWTPPVVVENAVSDVGMIGGVNKDNTPVRVEYTGWVRWYPPLSTVTSCDMKIAKYPFDTQTCFITLTAWGLSTKEMLIQDTPINLTYFPGNGEWDLLEYWSTTGAFHDNVYYTRLNLHFSFRRKWQFYSQNLILPIVLTSVLMTCVFALPLDSGEKMGYVLTVLLAYVVFLTWVTDNLPSVSNDTSVLQIYLACVLCLGILATVLTCWVVHMHHREPNYPMSALMRLVVTGLLVPLKNCTCCKRQQRHNVVDIHPPTTRYNTSEQDHSQSPGQKQTFGSDSKEGYDNESTKKVLEHDGKPEELPTWQEVAAMFDFLFLITYLIVLPVLTVTVLLVIYDGY